MRLFATVCAFVFFASLHSAGWSQQVGTKRSIFAADYQKKIAAVLSEDEGAALQLPIGDIHDVQQLPNGHWLLQTTFTNVVEVDAEGKEVWKYEAGKTASGGPIEIHAFRRLPNGLTMIAESGAARIIEVDKDKKIVHAIPLTVPTPDAHRDTRLVRPTPEGNYLVAHEALGLVREYDRKGKIVWEYNVGSKLYSAVRLPNGNTLVGTGDGHRVIEVTHDKKIVWEVTEKELPGVQLAWITMVDRLPNGNTWIVNCHAGPENPQILEVTPDKKVVWSFKDFERFGNALPVAVPVAVSNDESVKNLKAYPPAPEGSQRFVVHLEPQENEEDFRVELQIGKTVETDAANRYFFGGSIVEETVEGWGFLKFVVKELGPMAGTLIAVDPKGPKVKRFITLGGEPKLLRYNSKLPLVIYVPKGTEVRYRIWKAESHASVASEG